MVLSLGFGKPTTQKVVLGQFETQIVLWVTLSKRSVRAHRAKLSESGCKLNRRDRYNRFGIA